MEIVTADTDQDPQVDSYVLFIPWPFEESQIRLKSARYIMSNNTCSREFAPDYVLDETCPYLVRLSDRSLAVASEEWTEDEPIVWTK